MRLLNESIKSRIPWFIKVPAKIALSRIPIRSKYWQQLNIFKAGAMDTPQYAFDIFKKHFDATAWETLAGRSVLELGPGNSGLTALFARVFDARCTWMIDVEALASQDAGLFAQAERMILERNLPVPGVGKCQSVDIILERLNSFYLTKGLESLRTIPDGQIDFLFSNAVLEHIRLAHFEELIAETRRVLKPNGIASHVIDFRDHLQHGLNNLRFSERVWESEFMARSGFYTNRLTWRQMDKIFRDAGFSITMQAIQAWPSGPPLKQRKMASPFKDMAPDAFTAMGAHVILRTG
jgi:SAM-dependent methyltransferase